MITRENRLIATKDIKEGDRVHTIAGQMMTIRTRESVEVDGYHIDDPLFRYCNHSFNPNVRIEGGGEVIAIRDIKTGEEICFDYTENEKEISHPFIDRKTGKEVK